MSEDALWFLVPVILIFAVNKRARSWDLEVF